MKHNIETLLYKQGRRTHQEATTLKHVMDECMVVRPTLYITTSFRYAKRTDKTGDILGSFIHRMSTKVLDSHILPLVVYNDKNGYVRNDIHMLLLTENNKNEDIALVKDYFKSSMNKHFGNSDIRKYTSTHNAVQYLTLRHRPLGIVMGCPMRTGSCRRNKCKYKHNPSFLLNDRGISYMESRLKCSRKQITI